MQLIRPITIDDAVMTYTNVPEDDAPTWDSTATYATGAQVVLEHVVYESLIDNNSADPRDGVNADPATWLRIGMSRPWRPYDSRVRNVTQALEPYDAVTFNAYDDATEASGIALTLTPNALVDGLALLNINALFAHVKVETVDGIVYESRTPLSGGLEESTWHSYFYTPIDRRTQLILTDLPRALDAQIHVALEETEAQAQLGELVLGRVVPIGRTLYGSGPSIIDYSRKERDEFGNLLVVKRRYTKLMDYRVAMERRQIDAIYHLLAEIRTDPTVWIGHADHSSLVVYGIYNDMNITFDNYSVCEASIEVEEV